MEAYFEALLNVLQPGNLLMLWATTIVGIILGAIPGLAGGLGITLCLPLTFAMETDLAFCMLLGMYVGGMSGGFIASVLVGIPGTPASIPTTYDGYPMTKQGKAAKALTIGLTASFLGTAISVIVATICSGLIADLALALGPWEYFSLCFMAVSLVVGMGRGSIYKGLLAAFLGLFMATIGIDSVSGQMRYTFNNFNLYGGVNVVCLMMGTFALQQVAMSYAKGQQEMPEVDGSSLGGFGLKLKDFTDNIKEIVVPLLIGLFIGFLPGMGGGVASMISYGQMKKTSKTPEKFGTGHEAGLWASETANNAGIGGAIIPLISLGIPGDGTTMLLLSAMTIHGLQAGPTFIQTNPAIAYLILAAILVSAILTFFTELFTKRWFPLLLKIPYHYLFGAILVISFVGAFTSSTSMFSVGLAIFFGIFGIILHYFEIPDGPMMLAFILGKNLENYFRRGCSYAKGDMTTFLTRPASCIMLLIGLYSLFSPLFKYLFKQMKAKKNK